MNVIPFIDVMLVLLAIVLTTATFVAQGRIPVNLPAAEHADPVEQGVSVELAIVDDGSLYVDGDPMTLESMEELLGTLAADTAIVLRVDEQVAFHRFVSVIDLLKAAGLSNLSIITRERSS
ncbi:MAG: biopolymer transporter ExbD [Gammaproteobacteria bacterium]|nr:biopolymer transporter ExbD [Gammaproteobacteria bacterium]